MDSKRISILKNSLITIGILGMVTILCFMLQNISDPDNFSPLLFVLAVLFVSRFTEGYVYGIVASVIAVIGVNCIFTYPYFAIDFTITGYPLTFLSMLAVSCIVSALTTQIRNQEQIRLEVEKEKMKGNLLRAVSHDIRTPLTSIVGAASGITENYDALSDERIQELAGDIRDEAQWLIRIVENLLSITRIGVENARIDKQEELVEEIVGGAVWKFQKRFPAVQVCVHLPEEVLLVPMDGILIEQVLVNLLENAVYHGKKVTLIDIFVNVVANRVEILVEDNGVGIQESVLPRMFDGELQPEGDRESDSRRNMGIGLSVCMSIVKAHRGTMWAENKKEGGARVGFCLPRE